MEYKTLIYKDLIQGVELEDGKVKYDKEFWDRLNGLMGEYVIEHEQIKTTELYTPRGLKTVREETIWQDGGNINSIIEWVKGLNLPSYLFNVFVLDIQKSFKERKKLVVNYVVPPRPYEIKQNNYDGKDETSQYYSLKDIKLERESLKFFLRFEYSHLECNKDPHFEMRCVITEEITDYKTECLTIEDVTDLLYR